MKSIYSVEVPNTEHAVVIADDEAEALLLLGDNQPWIFEHLGTADENQPSDVIIRVRAA